MFLLKVAGGEGGVEVECRVNTESISPRSFSFRARSLVQALALWSIPRNHTGASGQPGGNGTAEIVSKPSPWFRVGIILYVTKEPALLMPGVARVPRILDTHTE